MGVMKLMNFIESKCPSIVNHYSPLHYKNKTLAIDSPSAIYKFLIKTISKSILMQRVPITRLTFPWIRKVIKPDILSESCIAPCFVSRLGSNPFGCLTVHLRLRNYLN